jgi:peptidyl-prolyl cis-trans isomerase D
MTQEADHLGLKVTDAELRAKIAGHPVFQFEGGFSEEAYRRVLAANNMTPAQFEDTQRQEVVLEKLRRLVTGFAKVSQAEAFADWLQQNEKVAVDYAVFGSADFASQVKISDQDLGAFYETHKEGFRKPARVRLGYAAFDLAALAKQTAPSEQEVRAEYEQFQDDYWTPKEVKARHILLTVGAGANKEQERVVEQKALALLAEARSGADFSELARKRSEDAGTAVKGGDLGWFGEGQMVEEFEQAAFALSKGGLGGPVRTPFGYHIIKVDDVKEPRQRSFEEAKGEIVQALAMSRAQDVAEKRLAETHAKALKAGGLKKLVAAEGLPYQETGFLAQGEAVPGLADSGRIVSRAAAGKVGEIDSDEERALGPVLFQVLERRAAYVPPLAEVADQVRQKMVVEKALELSGAEAAKMLSEAQAGADFQAAAAKHGAKVGQAGPFMRSNVPPILGPKAAQGAFGLRPERPLGNLTFRSPQGYVVLRLKERVEPKLEEFSAQKAQAVQRLLGFKRQEIFDQWLKQLREKADIEVVNKVF